MAGLLGSGARVGVAAWGRAGCWPRGVSAPATASPAAASMLGRPAPARCPMLGRCPSPGPNAGSVASSATWSARPAKVPGGNPLGTAIPGPRRVRRLLARAAALRRARAPGRREGRFVYRERKGILFEFWFHQVFKQVCSLNRYPCLRVEFLPLPISASRRT